MSSDLTYISANGYWSTYMGSGASANLAANAAWAFASNFTIETHFFIPSYLHSGNEVVFYGQFPTTQSFGLSFSGASNNARWNFYVNSTTSSSLGTANTANTFIIQNRWNHVAVVRNSGVITLYVNGTGTGTTITNSSSLGYSANPAVLARMPSGIDAYFYNFRVTNTAVYTGNFTPSNTPYSSNSSTLILTFQDSSLIDRSPSARAITNTTANIAFSESYLPGNSVSSTTLRTFSLAASTPIGNTIVGLSANSIDVNSVNSFLTSVELLQNTTFIEPIHNSTDTILAVDANTITVTTTTPGGTVTTGNTTVTNTVQYWG